MNQEKAGKVGKGYTIYTGTGAALPMTESEIRISELENEVSALKDRLWQLLIIIGALGLIVVKLMTDIEHMKG